MKKSKFVLVGLFIAAVLGSCSKEPNGNLGNLITPNGNSTFAIANNGGNVTCDEVALATGCSFENTSERIDYFGGTGGTYGPITWTTDGTYVTWSSAFPVKIAIIIKGGPNANVYSDCSACKSGSGSIPLSAPLNPKTGKPYGLSNITFCYSICPAEKVIAFKGFLKDGSHCVSSGNLLFSAYSDKWCGPLGYNYYTPSTFNIVMSPPAVLEPIGNATVLPNGDVKFDLNPGFELNFVHLYIGTLASLQAGIGTYGCPAYEYWPYFDINGDPATITPAH
jgi:hypothetical protein